MTSATVPVEICSRWDKAHVLFRADIDASIPMIGRVKAALHEALKERADLGGADLGGANLGGAYLRGADLGGADLGGADLGGANLGGAYLRGADLGGAKIRLSDATEISLAAERGMMSLSPIGSEGGTLMLYRSEHGGVYAQRGCFGPAPLSEFAEAVEKKHGTSLHGDVYRAAIAMAMAWAAAPDADGARPMNAINPNAFSDPDHIASRREERIGKALDLCGRLNRQYEKLQGQIEEIDDMSGEAEDDPLYADLVEMRIMAAKADAASEIFEAGQTLLERRTADVLRSVLAHCAPRDQQGREVVRQASKLLRELEAGR